MPGASFCYEDAMIRQGTIEDLDAIVEGNRRMAEETESLALDVATLRSGVSAVLTGARAGRYFVIEEEGGVVAQLMITYEWSDWRDATVWWIQSVYVAPSHRGRGLYRRLYEHVRDAAHDSGAAGIRLYVDERNAAAQKVYAALGMDGEHYRVFEAMF